MDLIDKSTIDLLTPGKLIAQHKYSEPILAKAISGKCPACKQSIILTHQHISLYLAIFCQYCKQRIEL